MSAKTYHPGDEYALPNVQEFATWIRNNSVGGQSLSANSRFIPFPALRDYLKAEDRTSRILRELFGQDNSVEPESVEQHCPRTLAILVSIGKGRYIRHFMQHKQLHDTHLPFDSKPETFPIEPGDPTFWDAFREEQLAFSAYVFEGDYLRFNTPILDDSLRLPIISKEPLATGGSAALYKIQLHPYYDRLNCHGSLDEVDCDAPPRSYVLKTYNTQDAHIYYKNEDDAFKKLNLPNSDDSIPIIQYWGGYKHGGAYNIILEYADGGTLEDYFQKTATPSKRGDIALFWTRFLDLIKALSRVHETTNPRKKFGAEMGFHQDIKRDNILVVSGSSGEPYDVYFKLADFGLSQFCKTGEDIASWGTRETGAPEIYRRDVHTENSSIKITSAVDIWSFGCLCSEAAVWIVRGHAQLLEYRRLRRAATDDIPGFRDGAAFHDGKEILPIVSSTHYQLVKMGEIRIADRITEPVVDGLISWMLKANPEVRQDAPWLWGRWQDILESAQSGAHLDSNGLWTKPGQPIQPRSAGTFPATSNTTSAGTNGKPYGPPPILSEWSGHAALPKHRYSLNESPKLLNGFTGYVTSPSSPSKEGTPFNADLQTTRSTSGSVSYMTQPGSPGPMMPQPPFPNESQPEKGEHESRSERASQPMIQMPITPLSANTVGNSGSASLNTQHEDHSHTPSIKAPKLNPGGKGPQRSRKHKPPYLSFADALRYRCKKLAQLPDNKLLNNLRERDHKFLIEDTESMRDHWVGVQELFDVLAYIIKQVNDKGFEVSFTVSLERRTLQHTTPALDLLRSVRPRPRTGAISEFDLRLGNMLDEYKEKMRQQGHKSLRSLLGLQRRKVKPLSIYVFTDAAWSRGTHGASPVRSIVQELKELNSKKEQVSVQFIQFGNDQDATRKLNYLDSGLRKELGKEWDIVDTEPYLGGNVWKMLLGAVSDFFDNDDDDDGDTEAV